MCKSVFRNLLQNYFFWVILFLLLGINVYRICYIAGQRNEELEGHDIIYREFKGEMLNEKILKVVNKYQQLREIVETDNYNHEGGQPGTYTGYFAGDYGEIQEIFEEYKYRYEYSSYAKKIVDKPMATGRIKQAFAGRKLELYYDMKGPRELLEYDFYTLLCVVITIFFACKIVMYDKKQNMYILLETCSLGMHKIMARKILSLILFVFLAVGVFSILNLGLFYGFYDMEGMKEPLYAIQEYKNTLFPGSVLQFWLIQALGVCLSCVFLGIISMFFATIMKEDLYAMLLSILVYVVFVALFFKTLCLSNPVGLLAATNLIKDRDLYWYVFATVFGITVLCLGGFIRMSGSYRVSNHS